MRRLLTLRRLRRQHKGKVLAHTRRVTGEEYVTGTGQRLVNVHLPNRDCFANGCVIHAPTREAEAIGPTHYREDRRMMERICKHGVGHPDPDAQRWAERTFGPDPNRGIHGCDGCCA